MIVSKIIRNLFFTRVNVFEYVVILVKRVKITKTGNKPLIT